jgi:hypothetical protein
VVIFDLTQAPRPYLGFTYLHTHNTAFCSNESFTNLHCVITLKPLKRYTYYAIICFVLCHSLDYFSSIELLNPFPPSFTVPARLFCLSLICESQALISQACQVILRSKTVLFIGPFQ